MEKDDADKAREEAAQRIAAAEAKLNERKIGLDTHEEELATREEALAGKLCNKDG